MSNILTYFARGNVPLSISLTAVTTIGSLLTTPLILGVLAARHLPGELEMPVARIAFEICVCLIGPLSLGMLIGSTLPAWRGQISTWAIRGSLAVIVVLIAGAASADRVDPSAHGVQALMAIALFTVLACAAGYGACAAVRLPGPDRTAVAIEAAFRNSSLALLVKASVFPATLGVADPLADGVLFAVLMYAGVAMQVAMVPLFWNRWHTRNAVT